MTRSVVLGLVLLAGCTTEFDPRAETVPAFSVVGHVEAGSEADGQWVRVGRVRETADPDTTALDAAVTLEDLATGERWPMQDSLFTFYNGYRATNFWADVEAVPGHRYRLVIEGAGGLRATAEATTPPVPDVTAALAPTADPARYLFQGVDRIDDLLVTYECRLPSGATSTTGILPTSVYERPDGIEVVIYWSGDTFPCMHAGGEVRAAEVKGTFFGEGWPDLRGTDPEAAAVRVANWNVSGGLGFFGGAGVYRFPVYRDLPTL